MIVLVFCWLSPMLVYDLGWLICSPGENAAHVERIVAEVIKVLLEGATLIGILRARWLSVV